MGRSRVTSGLLSVALPGAGQLYAGARGRGTALLAVTALLAAAAATLVAVQPVDPLDTAVKPWALSALLAANGFALCLRLYAVVDAWRAGGSRPAGRLACAALVLLVAVTAAPHAAIAWYAVRGYDALAAVFAEHEPRDVVASDSVLLSLPVTPRPTRFDPPRRGHARPQNPKPTPFRGTAQNLVPYPAVPSRILRNSSWVTILLIGSDHGPERAGHRTDTMIVVALERGTRRALALGVPRNLVDVPLVGDAARAVPRFRQPLNALYQFALEHTSLFPGGENPGATALKQTLSNLLGIRIDYYAFVDLNGFVEMVDALGGVRIDVKERLVDSVTRPAWGETKPRIDVRPGRAYTFSGRTALAYVRSRKASSDYTRMARQRCFLSALARQVDVKSVLLHFGSLTRIARENVRTDIPLRAVPDLVRLARAVDPRLTVTETFGPEFTMQRWRRPDGYPRPVVWRMRAAVQDAILAPLDVHGESDGPTTVARSC